MSANIGLTCDNLAVSHKSVTDEPCKKTPQTIVWGVSRWRCPMPTFATPTPLTERITNAKRSLNEARASGQQPLIEAAERVLNSLIDRLPRRETP